MKRTVKVLCAVVAIALISGVAQAQLADSSRAWKKTLVFDLTATQAAYSDSWTGGEVGSFSYVSNLNGSAERQFNDWFNFRSTLKLSFGQTVTQDQESGDWSKPKKSTDLIDWETVSRFTVNQYVDPYAAFRLESQFYDGSIPVNKRYLSPMKLTESIGAAHRFFERGEDEHITTRFGLALREIITKQFVDTVGIDTVDWKATNVTATDGGLESVTEAVVALHEDLLWASKLTMFKALYYSKRDEFIATPQADDWKWVDVNWENIFVAQVSKIIAVSFYTQFLYDRQVTKKGRIKETLGLGITLKMM